MVVIEDNCWYMFVNLWNVFDVLCSIGILIIGFFEVCMFGGLVFKCWW